MTPRRPNARPARPTNRGPFRLRVPELLAAHGLTAYELAKRSGGRISERHAHRLAAGDGGERVSLRVLGALADVFGLGDDAGALFTRDR